MIESVPAIRLAGLIKTFGSMNAVDNLDLDIIEGEFFSMLGPSGSGKTTVLRLIAGFEQPTSGTIELAGEDVTSKAPFARDVNTVFQDYALFPHMSVLENIAYGLRVRGVGKQERLERAHEALESVQLATFGSRKPSELSGGQRQRVALARATVVRPKVLLLDEPLGALDLKLREQMQVELKELQRSLGITFIFVTHDQEEALTLSDRIAVFNNGKVEQLGTPSEIYERPRSPFVAGFVGTSNIFDAGLSRSVLGREGINSLRPERLTVRATTSDAASGTVSADASAPPSSAVGTISEVIYIGTSTRILVDLEAGLRITALEQNVTRDAATAAPLSDRRGERVIVEWAPQAIVSLTVHKNATATAP
jgi:putative spermidine/putrescine transport system ATP-binding protein